MHLCVVGGLVDVTLKWNYASYSITKRFQSNHTLSIFNIHMIFKMDSQGSILFKHRSTFYFRCIVTMIFSLNPNSTCIIYRISVKMAAKRRHPNVTWTVRPTEGHSKCPYPLYIPASDVTAGDLHNITGIIHSVSISGQLIIKINYYFGVIV